MNDDVSVIKHFRQPLHHHRGLLWMSANSNKLIGPTGSCGSGHPSYSGHDDEEQSFSKVAKQVKYNQEVV